MGYREYEPISARYKVPIVITGFEPLDLLEGTLMAVRQLEQGRAETENQYARAVERVGNEPAQRMIFRVFSIADRAWRGIGIIPKSGYKLSYEFRDFDAERIFEVANIQSEGAGHLHQRPGTQGAQETARLPRIRHGMHASDAAGRDHGLGRRGLRRLLQLRAAHGRG